MKTNPHFYPVILAGGRGTRFWPLSRKRRAKQLLALDGKHTMIQQTVARLAPMAAPSRFWIITNDDLRPAILRQLPKLRAKQIIAEPAGRNTAPAIGLAAFLLLRHDPDAVLGLFPSDHVIAEPTQYRATLSRGIEIAAASALELSESSDRLFQQGPYVGTVRLFPLGVETRSPNHAAKSTDVHTIKGHALTA